MKRVYLDNAATTPVRPEVVEIMNLYMLEVYGNPSSVHWFGQEAKKGVEEARERVAVLIGAKPEEIVFTGGATEADNLAIKGVAEANMKEGTTKHIITSAIEHHAVLHTCQYLEKRGFEVTYLPVDRDGLVDPDDVRKAIKPNTILITVIMGNNEVGTIEPVKEIGAIAREMGVAFHTDATQCVGHIPVDVDEMNIDLLSLSGHKMYGPKGIGALYVRKGVRIRPILHGGGHERGRRAGTENVPGIVGLGKAAELARMELPERQARLTRLRDKLIDGLMERIDEIQLNGHREKRLPGNVNVSVKYVEGESMLLNLDLAGIAASSGSACTSGSLEPSHVLLALGVPPEVAHGSLRMSLGWENTEEDVDYVLETLPGIVHKLRQMSPLYTRRGECACTTKK
ncbi:MAG TPA: cysteine desulfurase NifS [Firmicutes bacterium]|nr:cysteine desulfurase NifS [Bacillota bacterium]